MPDLGKSGGWKRGDSHNFETNNLNWRARMTKNVRNRSEPDLIYGSSNRLSQLHHVAAVLARLELPQLTKQLDRASVLACLERGNATYSEDRDGLKQLTQLLG